MGARTGKIRPVRVFSTIMKERSLIMELMKNRLANLVSVKSLVTLVLTAVFAYLAVAEKIAQDFMTVYAVVIAFYFGTQSQKGQDMPAGDSHE